MAGVISEAAQRLSGIHGAGAASGSRLSAPSGSGRDDLGWNHEERTMSLDRILAILSALVAFDTTSRDSNLAIIDWIERHLDGLGLASERIYDATGQKANLYATIGPAEVPGYILSGHTDVVPVDGQEWSSDPFSLKVEGERAYGRGVCDMKGFLAVCLAAVEGIRAGDLKRPIHLAFSYDE